MTLQSYINEIETQSKKPIDEQLNDIKLAGAKLLQSIDNLLPIVDKVVKELEKESNSEVRKDQRAKEESNRLIIECKNNIKAWETLIVMCE